jgi:hypothetical protein
MDFMMSNFSQKDLSDVENIRKNVEDAEKYFSNNKTRFSDDKSFAFKTTVTTEDRNALSSSNYPVLDINVIEPYISRYCGNFYKQSPEIEVRSEDLDANPDQIDMIEGIMRAVFYGSNYKHIAPKIVKDQLCGYAVWEVDVDYKNEESFDKVISLKYQDPMMCGFDPMATGVAKEDAMYYYKLYPMTKEQIKDEYPGVNLDNINKMPLNLGAGSDFFNWKRKIGNKDVYYIADYYQKKYKNVMYYQISDPENPRHTSSMSEKEYEEKYTNPDNPMNPEILQKKTRSIPSLKRYKVIGNQLLEKPEKIDGTYNRLIFVDGNSVSLENQQYTRSYFYNVKDSQRIKNRCLSNSIYEMMTLRKSDIFIAEEALPESKDAINAYKDVERSKGALTYRAFKKDGTPLPAPSVQPRGQINSQTIQLFEMSDKTIQSQFGTYDAQRGMQKNLSGKAIVEGAMESSDSSMPFIINYIASLKQVAMVILDLIPIYYTTLRTMPYIEQDGSKTYVTINDPSKPQTILDYNVNSLGVEVEAGPSFDIQRRDSLQTLIQAMGVSDTLKQIMDGPGLNVLVKNIDIKERQRLLQLVQEHQEQKQKMAQSQPDPMQLQMQAMMAEEKRKDELVELKHQELLLKASKQKQDFSVDVEKLRQSNEKLEEELMGIKATMLLRAQEANNEKERTDAELYIKQIDAIMAQEKHQIEMLRTMSTDINQNTKDD